MYVAARINLVPRYCSDRQDHNEMGITRNSLGASLLETEQRGALATNGGLAAKSHVRREIAVSLEPLESQILLSRDPYPQGDLPVQLTRT
jgi:hypothetical protein